VTDVETAIAAGADRLELCSALELGGLTPSDGLVEAALAASPIPIVVMVRPRAGGFCYDRHEFAVMLRDAGRFLEMGACGIVFGILDQKRRIDAARSRELINLAGSVESVFHRAVDCAEDQKQAIDALIELECTRVLTSGGKPTAYQGVDEIRGLVEHAKGRIEILPGGGINAANVAEIVRLTGSTQVHVGASSVHDDGSILGTTGIELCDRRFMEGVTYRAVAADAVAAARSVLTSAALDN
jgi:copper homeostasis protein